MRLLQSVNRILAVLLDWGIALSVTAIVVILFVSVVMRYVFSAALFFAEEMSILAMIWMTFLAGAILVRQDRNVIITVFADLFSPRVQHCIRIFADFLSLIMIAVMVWLSWKLVDKLGMSTTPALRLSEAWFAWSMVVGFGIMLFYQVQRMLAYVVGMPPLEEGPKKRLEELEIE
ncbi:MAG TPA: TRAP transporter small permease [Candidatus Acidoferrum sp.]|nr:TRAP transporter small permease [Candidatus Acidoferrum sp.]